MVILKKQRRVPTRKAFSFAVEDAVGVRLKMLFSLLVERDFMITTDPRPLMVLFGIQNEDLRDLIAQ